MAQQYARWRGPKPCLQEGVLLEVPVSLSEHQLQAHWFAGDFGREFISRDGHQIRIVQFGLWNQEAGPDFIEAAVSIDDGPPQRGSIELDTDARDWEHHNHATNPDYDNVVLHLFTRCPAHTFFTRTVSHRNVPQVLLDPTRLSADVPNPLPLAKGGRCIAHLRLLPPEKLRDILMSAARFRLQRKATSLLRLGELHGPDEALYQAIAATMGYKNNKLPFTLLAQRLPLSLLLREKQAAEGLLFGVSGFLASADPASRNIGNPANRAYLRSLWENWWPYRSSMERLILEPGIWSTSGQRPLNHPHRRLAALAAIVAAWHRLKKLFQNRQRAEFAALLAGLSHPFWRYHFTFGSKPARKPMALLGQSRITDLLANVFYPLAINAQPELWTDYLRLPAVLSNRRLETALVRFFDGNTAIHDLPHSAAFQQGLLQLYEDFCMQDATDCHRCPFPEQLAAW